MLKFVKRLGASAIALLMLCGATLLPNAEQQFTDGAGVPYALGTVCFYVPSTLTPKTTWTDTGQTTPNTTPCVTLDASGRAQIYGQGQYREILKDASSNQIWDQLTQDVQGLIPIFSGLTSTGSANAQVLTYSPAIGALAVGQIHVFVAGFSNNAAATLTVNTTPASGAISIFKATAAGPAALVGGEINANDLVIVAYDGTRYQLVASIVNLSSVNTTLVMNGAAINEAQATIAAASTTNIGAAAGNYLNVTVGTGTINAFDVAQAGTERTLKFAGIVTLTFNSTSMILLGNTSQITAVGDTAKFRSEGAGNWREITYFRAGACCADATTMQSFVGGFGLTNDGGNPNTVIDVAQGDAVSDDNTTIISHGAIVKTTGSWAVGNNNGCLDTGAVGNSTWYHIFVIERTDTGISDVLCSTSATAPTMPAAGAYNKKRRVGSIKTDGSAHIISFKQTGNGTQRSYMWATAVTDISAGAISVSPVLTTLVSIPSGIKVDTLLDVTLRATTTSQNVAVYSADITGGQPSNLIISPNTTTFGAGQAHARSNTAQQVFIAGGSATPTIDVTVLGWFDDL